MKSEHLDLGRKSAGAFEVFSIDFSSLWVHPKSQEQATTIIEVIRKVTMDSEQENSAPIATAPPPVPSAADTPQIPELVRVYGLLIMILNAIGMALGALQTVIALGKTSNGIVLVFGALGVGINYVLFRLGKGLRAGERQAVYGLCVLGAIVLLVGLGCLVSGEAVLGLVMLILLGIFYVPPVVSAFNHWTAFK